MPSSKPWPQAQLDKFHELYAQGLSFGRIALEMKMSRNAIIGKAHRLGLKSKKPKVVVPRPKKEPKQKVVAAPRQPKTPPLILRSLAANRIEPSIDLITKADDYVSMGVKLSKLEWVGGSPSNCRAVLRGDGKDAIYCGEQNVHGSSYCKHHTERFYAPHARSVRPYIPKAAVALK